MVANFVTSISLPKAVGVSSFVCLFVFINLVLVFWFFKILVLVFFVLVIIIEIIQIYIYVGSLLVKLLSLILPALWMYSKLYRYFQIHQIQ